MKNRDALGKEIPRGRAALAIANVELFNQRQSRRFNRQYLSELGDVTAPLCFATRPFALL